MRCLNITIVGDSDLECDHDFTVGIESISPAVSSDLSSSITVNIDDSVDGEPDTMIINTRDTLSLHIRVVFKYKISVGMHTTAMCSYINYRLSKTYVLHNGFVDV